MDLAKLVLLGTLCVFSCTSQKKENIVYVLKNNVPLYADTVSKRVILNLRTYEELEFRENDSGFLKVKNHNKIEGWVSQDLVNYIPENWTKYNAEGLCAIWGPENKAFEKGKDKWQGKDSYYFRTKDNKMAVNISEINKSFSSMLQEFENKKKIQPYKTFTVAEFKFKGKNACFYYSNDTPYAEMRAIILLIEREGNNLLCIESSYFEPVVENEYLTLLKIMFSADFK